MFIKKTIKRLMLGGLTCVTAIIMMSDMSAGNVDEAVLKTDKLINYADCGLDADLSQDESINSNTDGFIHSPNERKVKSLSDYSNVSNECTRQNTAIYNSSAASQSSYTSDALTSTKNQGSYNTCWAFSVIGMAESELIKNNSYADTTNLSELQLAYYTYKNTTDPLGGTVGDTNTVINFLNNGGSFDRAFVSLANWCGATDEDKVPYSSASSVYGSGLDSSYEYDSDTAHLENYYLINSSDRTDIKQAIVDHGAVGIGYCQSSEYYDSATNVYYDSDSTDISNHAVIIIGWDDAIEVSGASENGAWLVKNSWGTNSSQGDSNGYFYISYCDATIFEDVYAIDMNSSDNYDNNYQYDGGIYTGETAYYISNKSEAANVYTAKANSEGSENIEAVSFYSYGEVNCKYTVNVYTNLTNTTVPDSGTLSESVSGTTTYEGYYTIPLDTPVWVKEGESYAIDVILEKDSSKSVRIGCEESYNTSTTSASAGQSYVRKFYNKKSAGWYDYGLNQSGNIRIKAFTSNDSYVPIDSFNISKTSLDMPVNATKTITSSILPVNATNKDIIWNSSDASVATVSTNGAVTALKAGSTTITATVSGESVSAACSINVEVPVESINMTLDNASLTAGESTQIIYSILPLDATDNSITWTSSDENVATVSNGVITAIASGNAVIKATSANMISDDCETYYAVNESIAISVKNKIVETKEPSSTDATDTAAPVNTSDVTKEPSSTDTTDTAAPVNTSDVTKKPSSTDTTDTAAPVNTSDVTKEPVSTDTTDTAAPVNTSDVTKTPSSTDTTDTAAPVNTSQTTSTPPAANPQTTSTTDENADLIIGNKYVVANGTYEITNITFDSDDNIVTAAVAYSKASSTSSGNITVPDSVTIDGIKCSVTSISSTAFSSEKNVKKIIIGKNVTKIGKNAFKNLTALKSIVIKSKVLKKIVGNKTFKLNKKVKITVPSSRYKKYRKMIKKAGGGQLLIKK